MNKKQQIKTPEETAYLKAFGKELQKLLDQAEISQRDFALILGTHFNSVNKWVNGVNYPRPLFLKKIIEYFLTNPKIKDFTPYTLLFVGEEITESVPDKIIKELKANYEKELNKQLKSQDDYWEKKYDSLNFDYEQLLESNKELSKQNYAYRKRYEEKIDYKKLKKEYEDRMNNFNSEARQIHALYLLKRLGMAPEATAKQILREPALKCFIEKLRLVNNDGTTNENYLDLYNDLIKTISDEISKKTVEQINFYYKDNEND